MATSLDMLKRQHSHMRALLQVLEEAIDRIDKGGRLDPYFADAAFQYIAAFPKTVHRPAEATLYEALGKANPSLATTAETVVAEHPEMQERASRVRDALYLAGQHPEFPRPLAVSMARTLIEDMRRHMAEEEGTLFPAAEELLDASTWAQIDTVAQQRRDASQSKIGRLRELFGQIGVLVSCSGNSLDARR